tara:strand:- start:3506 stop:3766 length:261 start_codon:yes stop_codon:yes gene_type:complete
MPKTSWFKHLWNWRKKKKSKDKGNMYRTQRMKSFKIKKISDVKVKAYDSNGNDLTRYIRSSFVYDGAPGGFYLDTRQMNFDNKHYY